MASTARSTSPTFSTGGDNRPGRRIDRAARSKGLHYSQRLGELLRAAERITPGQLEDALSEQRRSGCKLGEILIEKGVLTQRERDVVLEFQRHQAGAVPVAGKLYLGTILVATGQITRAQLEDALRRQAATGRPLGDELIEAGQASKGQIEGGLLLQRKLVTYALIMAMMLAPLASTVPSAEAGQTASMQVSVAVIANTKVRTDYQATQLKITEADVTRGYIVFRLRRVFWYLPTAVQASLWNFILSVTSSSRYKSRDWVTPFGSALMGGL